MKLPAGKVDMPTKAAVYIIPMSLQPTETTSHIHIDSHTTNLKLGLKTFLNIINIMNTTGITETIFSGQIFLNLVLK